MILVLLLLGIVLMLVLPNFALRSSLASTTRHLIGTIRTLSSLSVHSKQVLKLYLDFDQQAYWVRAVVKGEEQLPMHPGLGERVVLPEAIRLVGVRGGGKLQGGGQIVVQFLPTGRTDEALIQLVDQDRNVATLFLHPLTGSVKVFDRAVDQLTPDPLPDRVRLALLPPPGLGVPASPLSLGGR